ncbi:MAG: chemotaxis protein CheW [Alphaproteobacteria bacterium]|nr:chemotaxis protein CheW [Alphaproteobacteria bacterium]
MHDTAINQNELVSKDYLTVTIADQLFGIPVLQVQDVLRGQVVTKVPLAAPEIAGSLNLRGRVVTAIDVRKRLKLEDNAINKNSMSVVVEHGHELYSLIIDSVGDVLSLKDKVFEKNPGTLDPLWMDISIGIYQLEDDLLIIMDVARLLEYVNN